ncbi:amidohydrolase family protein [Aminobacter anthyllidis]|uniref:Amidohydrolase family protein n=1 Tax=Aminobacter anthyllidis TaxID=1035067 RepID=A0A9X1ACD1_9HYPH|nr:amidohydrolase family protein [Aminobacter anthyllidis]MBT1157152.1 amidohydrolase family protein [Aminobacter anthyllidis]
MKQSLVVKAPLVDTHAHIFRRDLPFIAGAPNPFERDYTAEDYVRELDTAGVSYGVIAAASFLGSYHDYTLAALARHRRLRATVIVGPDAPQADLREMNQAGVVGIRLATGNMASPPDLRSPDYRRLLGIVAELDWHVHVYGRRDHLPPMLDALDSAGVKTVVDHFGARDNEAGLESESFKAILRAMRKGRTWVKLSGPYLSEELDHRAMAARLLSEAGPTRLLWASDWPFVKLNGKLTYCQTIEWLNDWVPNEAVRLQMGKNALELYRLPRAA